MDAADLVRLVRETGSPYGVDPLPPVGAAVREALQTEARGTTDFVYVPSCESVAFDPSVLISAVSVLQSAGVGVRVVHPSCCGALLRDRGPAAAEFREAVAEAIALADGRRVVAEAGGCAEYLGAEPFAVVAAELLESGLLRPRRVE
ncbi:MAG TPA: hypothetical protein VNE62_00005, partial [Actinomycetota bacterium]|nr:hypothetical protein [Actinomycetota bacterium]